MNEKFEEWWIDNISMRWDDFMCKRGYHRKSWERWDGYEHCHCGLMGVDKDNFYEETFDDI
jgi:hypothetical protein